MNLKAFFTRELVPTPRLPKEQPCSHCQEVNELPFVFCEKCGAPRFKLGQIQATTMITLAIAAFLGFFYLKEVLTWPWTIYVLYVLLFMQFTLAFVAESRRYSLKLFMWMACIFTAFGVFFEVLCTEGLYFYIVLLDDLPSIAQTSPGLFYPAVLSIFTLAFLPQYFRWARTYGWVNAYRIAVLSMFMLSFGALMLMGGMLVLYEHQVLPTQGHALSEFATNVFPKYNRILSIVSLVLIRIFLVEIFVFAAVRGFVTSRKKFPVLDRQQWARESGFNKSLLLIVQVVRRIAYSIEQMLCYVFETFRHLLKDLAHVSWTFMLEIFFPIVSLSTAAIILFFLSFGTISYIEENSLRKIALMAAMTLGLIFCEAVFLGSKSRYRWSRISSVHAQFLGWLIPNFLIFFLLVSFSLVASTVSLKIWDKAGFELPFYLGLITKGICALLGVLVVIVLFRKRSLFVSQGVSEEVDNTVVAEENAPPASLAVSELAEEASELSETTAGESPVLTPLPEKMQQSAPIEEQKSYIPGSVQPVQSMPKTLPSQPTLHQLKGVIRTTSLKIRSTRFGQKASGALKRMNKFMDGKPEIVLQYENVQLEFDDLMRQIAGLESTREKISSTSYKSLRNQYEDRLQKLTHVRDGLYQTLRKNLTNHTNTIRVSQAHLAKLTVQLADLEQLEANNALSPEEVKTRRRSLAEDIEIAQATVDIHQRQAQYYLSHVPESSAVVEAEEDEEQDFNTPGAMPNPLIP